MESNVSYENEIEQLKIISENQEKLLKKLEGINGLKTMYIIEILWKKKIIKIKIKIEN